MAAQVRCGPRAFPMDDKYVGKTVTDIRSRYGRDLQIPEGSPATVSRDGGHTTQPVPETYRLQHGDLVEFVRPAGTKGSRILLQA